MDKSMEQCADTSLERQESEGSDCTRESFPLRKILTTASSSGSGQFAYYFSNIIFQFIIV